MIKIKDLTKIIGSHCILNNINMEIATGTTTGIIGRNGSGKTVLLKCICGLYEPTNGEILFQKDNCAKCVSSSGLIGAVIDSPGFLPNISGYKNLEYLSQIRNIPKDSIRHAMIEVGLDPKNRQPVKHYSLEPVLKPSN